jgi:hypothetical protein
MGGAIQMVKNAKCESTSNMHDSLPASKWGKEKTAVDLVLVIISWWCTAQS